MREVKEKQHTIVLRGSFSPLIFQPQWFAAKGLLGQNEAEKASIKIIHEAVTDFSLEWVKLQVLPEQWVSATSDEGHEEAVRDLVIGTFKLLGNTPVTALGINRAMHFVVENEVAWHEIGQRLVPKSTMWNDLLKSPKTAGVVVQGEREGDRPGFINVRVEPSRLYAPTGIFIAINDHYDVRDELGKPKDGAAASLLLEEMWEKSIRNSNAIADGLKEKL